jgi:type IV fimbrial biogenesis protein FimT
MPSKIMNKTLGKLRLHRQQGSGYTIVELLVVVGLIAIVTAMALPHFSALVDRWRVYQAVVALQNVLRFAQAQAIRTNSNVFVQAKSARCRLLPEEPKNWSCGVVVFQDINNNESQDLPDEPTLQELPEFHALMVSHTAGLSNSNAFIKYGPHGAPNTNSSFGVSPVANPNSLSAQIICQSFGGRLRVQNESKC